MKKRPGERHRPKINIIFPCGVPALSAALFCLLTGISAGAFLEILLPWEEREALWGLLNQSLTNALANVPPEVSTESGRFSGIFLESLTNNLGLLVLMALSGILLLAFPVAFLLLAYKGMALGFSAALLIEAAGGTGILLVLGTLFLPGLLLLPVFLLAAAAAGNLAVGILVKGRGNIKKNLSQRAGPYLAFHLLLWAVALGGCLAEAWLSPALAQALLS